MNYQYIPIIWPLSISGLLTLSLGIFAQIKRRKAQGVEFFALSMFIVTFWSIPNALEMAAVDLSVKLFWANMQYIAYCFSPVSLLILCMEATGHSYKEHKNKLKWLFVLPCISLILVWTNQLHGLIRYDVHLAYSGAFYVIAKKYGGWFYIHAAYSHCLNLWAVAVLLRTALAKRSVYKKQASYLLIGTSFIIIPNLIYIIGISPLQYDITPLFFGPAGVMMLWSIFHNRMFELVPLARTAIIEAMDAGVMVLDIRDRILDMNPAFKRIIGISVQKYYLLSIDEVCMAIPELVRIIKDGRASHTDFSITGEKETRVFEILLIPLYDKKDYYIGRLAVLHDITEKKQAQQEFLKQQWQLAVIDERERISRDLHDNLGQVLGFINLQAQAIRQELVNEGIDLVYDKLDRLIKVTQNMHAEIREYISSVRTSVITERDFITSLKNDIMNFEQQTGLKVKLDILEDSIEKEFNMSVKVNIQNIIREAMNNIRKHAQAHEVIISFQVEDKQMTVSIADDGKGFHAVHKDDSVKNKFGLDIMKERAALIGGYITIESVPDKGSKVTLYVPRKGEDDTNEYESNAGG